LIEINESSLKIKNCSNENEKRFKLSKIFSLSSREHKRSRFIKLDSLDGRPHDINFHIVTQDLNLFKEVIASLELFRVIDETSIEFSWYEDPSATS
jgi:hypothetical protein